MALEVSLETYRWLSTTMRVIRPEPTLQPNGNCVVAEELARQFENGTKVGELLAEIFKIRGLPPSANLSHLKKSTHTAAQLYNWNILNEVTSRVSQVMRKLDFEVDSDTKNLIINGDRGALVAVIDILKSLSEGKERAMEDSLEALPEQQSKILEESNKASQESNIGKPPKKESKKPSKALGSQDLLEYVLDTLSSCLKLTRKQAIALIAENNKYLAHVMVKGVKGSFVEVEEIMQRFYQDNDQIIQRIVENNDMCVFYLQAVKPALLSKNEQVAMWACRILTKVGYDLANNQLLPLAYDWFVRENGGLATTMLALNRHPKLNESAVGYILQFARFNVSELFTVELKKFCPDNLAYLKFILLIFDSLVESKLSAEELLSSGALDYWIEQAEKGADNNYRNSVEMRSASLELLTKVWRSYPIHVEEELNLVGNIMNYVKKGIRDDSSILRFSFLEELFALLHHFASQKNPFASVLYKKITFMFIENHEIVEFREYVLRSFREVFRRFQSIPVEIFLEPFVKQLKISQGRTYILNVFDMEFVKAASEHRRLKVKIAIELFDFLAKTFLHDNVFGRMARSIMEYLVDRFIEDDPFVEYCQKLVKICLAIFFSSLKKRPQGKSIDDSTRLAMQRRADIVQFLGYVIRKQSAAVNQELKVLLVHVRIQIMQNFKLEHRGITQLLKLFGDPYEIEKQVMRNNQEMPPLEGSQTHSESGRELVKLPRIVSRQSARDDLSQNSFNSKNTHLSNNTASKQEFPIRDYEEFETEEEKRFMKQHGIGLKKKAIKPQLAQAVGGASLSQDKLAEKPAKNFRVQSKERNLNNSVSNNAKVLEQIDKIRERKQEDARRKIEEQEKIDRKKEQLKEKIKKELEQRNLAKAQFQEKNMTAKVLFEENEINQKIMESDQVIRQSDLKEEETRDEQSVTLVLKKYDRFLKRLFDRYSNVSRAKGANNTFDDDTSGLLSQVELLKMFKEKNIEKNKTVLQQLLKIVSKQKGQQSIDFNSFLKLLEQYCISSYFRDRNCQLIEPMGSYLREIIRKLAVGENSKLDDEDEQTRGLNLKLRENPLFEIPNTFKKMTETVFEVANKVSHNNRQLLGEAYSVCYEIVNELIAARFKTKVIESHVFLKEEIKVVKKIVASLPPKPMNRREPSVAEEAQEKKAISMKREKSEAREPRADSIMNKMPTETRQQEGRSLDKKLNQAEKQRAESEEEKRKKQQQQEAQRKQRALQVKRKLEEQTEQRRKELQQKKESQKEAKQKQQERQRRQKQMKEQYLKEQKQKVQKYKRQQQKDQEEEKKKKEEQDKKTEEARRQALKLKIKREQDKKKQEAELSKKKKQKEEEQLMKKKVEQERKKELLKKKAQKTLEEDKGKRQQEKEYKQTLKNLYKDPAVAKIYAEYRDQLKALHSFGMEFNDYKIDQGKSDLVEQKGWLTITQCFELCDISSAQGVLKAVLRDKQQKGMSMESLEETVLAFACKPLLEKSEDYGQLKKQVPEELRQYLGALGIPKQRAKQKELFQSLKKGEKRQREQSGVTRTRQEQLQEIGGLQQMGEMQVENPDGKKQKWGVKNE